MDKGALIAVVLLCACICCAVSSLVGGAFLVPGSPLASVLPSLPGLPGADASSASTGGGGGGGDLGELTKEDGSCGSGKVKNDAGQCVDLTVESPYFGGGSGSGKMNECPDGSYVTGINVGYDAKVWELKYIAAGCSDGEHEWSHGRSAPSNLGKSIASALTMGISSAFVKPNGGYENRTWINPSSPGWDQVAYITEYGKKGGSRARAFGPNPIFNQSQQTGMFGVVDNVNFYAGNDGDKSQVKTWRCDENGKAPTGKRYAVVGIGTYSGSAIDRFNVKCRMFDTK